MQFKETMVYKELGAITAHQWMPKVSDALPGVQ